MFKYMRNIERIVHCMLDEFWETVAYPGILFGVAGSGVQQIQLRT